MPTHLSTHALKPPLPLALAYARGTFVPWVRTNRAHPGVTLMYPQEVEAAVQSTDLLRHEVERLSLLASDATRDTYGGYGRASPPLRAPGWACDARCLLLACKPLPVPVPPHPRSPPCPPTHHACARTRAHAEAREVPSPITPACAVCPVPDHVHRGFR